VSGSVHGLRNPSTEARRHHEAGVSQGKCGSGDSDGVCPRAGDNGQSFESPYVGEVVDSLANLLYIEAGRLCGGSGSVEGSEIRMRVRLYGGSKGGR